MTLLQIFDASRDELVSFLGFEPTERFGPYFYDYQIRDLARSKFYTDQGLPVPDNSGLPTYDLD